MVRIKCWYHDTLIRTAANRTDCGEGEGGCGGCAVEATWSERGLDDLVGRACVVEGDGRGRGRRCRCGNDSRRGAGGDERGSVSRWGRGRRLAEYFGGREFFCSGGNGHELLEELVDNALHFRSWSWSFASGSLCPLDRLVLDFVLNLSAHRFDFFDLIFGMLDLNHRLSGDTLSLGLVLLWLNMSFDSIDSLSWKDSQLYNN